MLTLSASSIKDFLKCSQMHYYRVNSSEEAVSTDEMIAGNIVHKVIEEYKKGIIVRDHRVSELASEYKLVDMGLLKRVESCLRTFFNNYENYISDKDVVERMFYLPYSKEVRIAGKMDRITPDGLVIDWKTGGYIPDNIDNDIQFILYYQAYKELYRKEPNKVLYVSLLKNKVIEFTPRQYYIDQLYGFVIPTIIKQIKNQEYFRSGLFTGACKNCSFQTTCWTDADIK